MRRAWRVCRPSDIHLKSFGTEFIAFDEFASATHLLGLVAGEIVLSLCQSEVPVPEDDLLRLLGLGDDAPSVEHDKLANILSELEQAELIEAIQI